MRILIVEDDRTLSDGLARYLHQAGSIVETAASGTEADTLLVHEDYDLVILDVGLPGMDGFEVLRRARKRGRYVPVLVLTARDEVEDRVHGLNLGADDYLVKPFSLVELEARVRAVIRRGQAMTETQIVYGPLMIDIAARRVWLANEPLRLTAREWTVLEFLVLRAGKMVSKDQIASAVSGWETDVSPNVVEVYISRLRSKLEPAGVKIHSIRGFGYYLDKPSANPN
ncbi:MAG: response regulator transcription factor [Burkholderiales bacterium]|nr:response regulator transcription factor [Burkholderiales bacterium]